MSSFFSRYSYSLIGFIFFQSLFCKIYSQNNLALPVVNKFESYNKKALQEKLFLHTDKDFYVAGEILWFKIYYVDGATHKPLQLSKVAYVEILNSAGKEEVQAKISLDPGQSKGSFYLPATLNSGNYTIRAYTNWMKNFDAGYFFEKKITLVNTLKNPEPITNNDSAGITIDFFPEGGNLVSDVQSKVGFKGTDNNGKGIDFSGSVINETGDTIVGFNPFKFGIGNFLFKPLSNHTYIALIKSTDGRIVRQQLPEVLKNGYVINLQDRRDDNLQIIVYRKKVPGVQNPQHVFLAAHTRQVLKLAEEKIINDSDSTVFLIAKSKIGTGITHFTIFDENGKPACERLFFIKPTSAVSINVKSDEEKYSTRHKVNLMVEVNNRSERKTLFNLSAAVFSIDSLQKTDQTDIVNYIWLKSDLRGDIESPDFYFSNQPGADVAVDNLMLTQGWRRFRWNDVLDEQTSFIKFLPEYNGQLISGRIKDRRDGKLVNNSIAFLSVPGHPFGFYVSKSNPEGLVQFDVKNYYGNGEIITSIDEKADSFYSVEILSPFIETDLVKKQTTYTVQPTMMEELQHRNINMQVQNVYSGEALKKFNPPFIADILPFFGYSESSYMLDDYKRFTTMEEVLREYVREINVGVRNGKLVIKMFSPLLHDFYDGHVLVLLDGVPLSDPNKILTYDPLKVKRLDIIQSQYILGSSIFNGIASFSTYEGVFDKFEFDPRLIAIDYDGLQLQREFYSPVYETKQQLEKRIPDFRSTLLWSPDITTGADGKAIIPFYTSDRSGKYMVIVNGMNANGDFVSSHTIFDVK